MFANKFGTHENVECGLVRLFECVEIGEGSPWGRQCRPPQKTAPIPLQSVSIVASVIHAVAQVELTQVYVNKEDQPIEAIYYFPVDSNGSVTHFHAELEGRTITGVVKPEEEAKAQYEKAVEEKQTAFLVESNKPDVFKVRVGFLKPGSQVKIVIGWVTEVKNEKGSNAIRFFIPTTVAPRYISPAETDEKAADMRKMTFSESSPAPLSLTVNVSIQGKIKSIDSLTHKIKTGNSESVPTKENWNRAVVTLDGNVTDMDRDFVLLVTPEQVHVPRLYSEKSVNSNSVAMMTHLIPSFNLDEQKVELIFVLDRSGSMQGTSIDLAKKALLLFLHSLPMDCYFNIVGFGSTFQFLFPESVQYEDGSLKKAIAHAENLNADLGGTEILEPLKAIYTKEFVPGHLRQIFILTDGEVFNTDQVIGICQANAHNTRVFALGIGDGASHALVEGIAAAGGGTAAFVSNNEPVDAKVLQQLKNAIQPSLTNVHIKWTGIPDLVPAAAAPVEINKEKTLLGYGKPISSSSPSVEKKPYWEVPRKIPPIFDGSQLVVFGVFPLGGKLPSGVEIIAESPDGPLSIEIKLSDENELGVTGMIHKLAAIKAIRELEITEAGLNSSQNYYGHGGKESQPDNSDKLKALKEEIVKIACDNGLASKYTSFVAVDSQSQMESDSNENNWIMQTRYVPSQFAHGWHGGGSYGMMSSAPMLQCRGRPSGPRSQQGINAIRKKRCVMKGTGAGLQNAPMLLSRGYVGQGFQPYFGSMSTATAVDSMEIEDQDSFASSTPALKLNSPQDYLHAIVATQSANGSFPLNEQFCQAIGKTLENLIAECKKGGFKEEAWATALALVYLTQKLSDLKDSWELVERKGKKWLQKNYAGEIDKLLATATEFLNSN